MSAAGEQRRAPIRATRRGNGARASLRSLATRAGLLSLLLLALFAVPASAAEAPTYLSSFGPDGTESTGFEQPGPIAVDQQTHNVYVLDADANALYKFDVKGQPVDFGGSEPYIEGNKISGLVFSGSSGEIQVAVDSTSHVIYVTSGGAVKAFQENGEPALFTAGPGAGTSEIGGFTGLLGVAVDGNGAIYASDWGSEGSDGVVKIYAPSGEPITQFNAANPSNLAVDTNGAVYVNGFPNNSSTIFKFTPSLFPVSALTTYSAPSAPINSRRSYSLAVDPSTNDLYVAEHILNGDPSGRIAWYDEDGNFLARFPEPGGAGDLQFSEGVAIDAQSKRVFVARNFQAGTAFQVGIFGPEEIFVGAPTIESTFATDVSTSSATLNARINPNTGETTYRFEYGLGDCDVSACTSVPLGGAPIGSGHELVAVSRNVAGLQPGTTYHYRVVAESSLGTTEGPGRTFTTQAGGPGFQLIDSRVWEMVSPSDKRGGDIIASQGGTVRAAESGTALAYVTRGSVEESPEGNRALELSSVLARRNSDGTWGSRDLTASHTEATRIQPGVSEYKLFSADLVRAALEPRDRTPLSPDATEVTPYLRTNTEPPSFDPLLNLGNVEPGLPWGGSPKESEPVIIAAATSDLSHVGLRSESPLVSGAESGSAYLWSGGELHVVSELPPGEGGVVRAYVGSGVISVRNAISDDGRRVFWSPISSGSAPVGLYLRDIDTGQSGRLDIPQPGASELGEEEPHFQGASVDGRVVFFTDTQQLTADASPSGRDLYRCEIPAAGGTGCATLTNISAPPAGESAGVMGVVAAIDEEGTRAYFVASGVLAENEGSGGEEAVAGEPNLYLWEEGGGVRFIATLSDGEPVDHYDGDVPVWGVSPGGIGVGSLTVAGSPDGRYFAFMSERSLTGYDNVNPSNGEALEEAFVYDAVEEDLTCVSCSPTEAAAEGRQLPPIATGKTAAAVDLAGFWGNRWVAATLPQPALRTVSGASFYHPRAALDNGRVFFNAVDPLVPADSNGEWDVYQFEPLGIGSCTESPASSAVARSGGGCVGLISSGTAEGESAFMDASASGDDVFFMTRGRLSVLDVDDAVDVYAARVNGVQATLSPNAECLGEACQPAALAPNDPTPASAAFLGPGNVKPKARKCPRGKRRVQRKGRTRCVPRKRGRHRKQQTRSGRGGRVGR
jgi:hypothetical protein